MAHELKIFTFNQDKIQSNIDKIAEMRHRYFQKYPYLYVGTVAAEKKYLENLMAIPEAILTVAKIANRIIGFCTGMPLVAAAPLLKEAKNIFYNEGLDSHQYFYHGEMVILPAFRNARTLLKIVQAQDQWAKSKGFMFGCLLTVMRKPHDPRIPRNYRPLEWLWQRVGYKRMLIKLYQQWPTIQLDGVVEEKMNELEFWEKLL